MHKENNKREYPEFVVTNMNMTDTGRQHIVTEETDKDYDNKPN